MEVGTIIPPIALDGGGQSAGTRFTLDLQSAKEEKDGHEPIVDSLMHGEREPVSSSCHDDSRRQGGDKHQPTQN